MTNVAICSIFYNSVAQGELLRYQHQIAALDWPHDALRVCCVEGDSTDLTWDNLVHWHKTDRRVRCAKIDLHEPYLGSIDNPRRLRNCSVLASYCRAMALRDDWADWVLWIESDLLWEPDLLKRLTAHDVDIVAPWVLVARDGNGVTDIPTLRQKQCVAFYDSWGFRWTPERYFGGAPVRPIGLTQVWSAGSCLLAKADVARQSNQVNDKAIVGWCEQAHAAGYAVCVDPQTEVWHPWPKGGKA
jgi:hypothetical protein